MNTGTSANITISRSCPYCGEWAHSVERCPQVSAITYDKRGRVRRVEKRPPAPPSPPAPPAPWGPPAFPPFHPTTPPPTPWWQQHWTEIKTNTAGTSATANYTLHTFPPGDDDEGGAVGVPV